MAVAARPVEWSSPGGCWGSGEGIWMVGKGFWKVWREFGSWVRFWSEVRIGVCCGVWKLWWMVGFEVGGSGKVEVR